MTFHNRSGEEFVPFDYPGADFLTRQGAEMTKDAGEGLYYRTRIFADLSEQVDECLQGEQAFSNLSIDALQAWNESAWKEPHGSTSAAERFVTKLQEEIVETESALDEYWDTDSNDHFIEEIGDLNWVFNALASNSKAIIGDSLKQRIYEYVSGTRVYDNGIFGYPKWYDTAGKLAIRKGSPTIGEIDKLIESGFYPAFSPAMNHYDEQPTESLTGYLFDMRYYAVGIQGLSEQLHGSDRYIPAGDGSMLATQVGKVVAEATLRTAAMAHSAGASLETVVERNVRKVTKRIELNIIDKDDGDRSETL